jgi:hypothetical protein
MVTSLLQSVPWFHDATLWHNDLFQSFCYVASSRQKNALSFPTKLCRFRQSLVVSDKRFVVSDKALSFLDNPS